MYQKILVPLDGSPEAETALPVALQLRSGLDAEVLLGKGSFFVDFGTGLSVA